MAWDSALRALSFLPEFKTVRGILLGRYPRSANVTRERLADMIHAIEPLAHFPVVANCDFGHTTPFTTVPVGGRLPTVGRARRSQYYLRHPLT